MGKVWTSDELKELKTMAGSPLTFWMKTGAPSGAETQRLGRQLYADEFLRPERDSPYGIREVRE